MRIDRIVETVDSALSKLGLTTRAVETWKAEMPTEAEMKPKDKYTIFDKKHKKYRKGLHSMRTSTDRLDSIDLMLTVCDRITQVDESIAACQSTWLLGAHKHTLSVFAT